MSKLKFYFLFLALLVSYSSSSHAQTFPNSPEPWRPEYNISLKNFTFSHPMTVINKEELEIIKSRITNQIEPQYSAFDLLLNEATNLMGFSPDPPLTMNIMGGYEPNSNLSEIREWLWRNCHAAYTFGLAYIITDDEVYAEKAKSILMSWAKKGTTFTGSNRGLQLGSWFSPMLYTADLIYGYENWSGSERDIFKSWWRQNCLIDGEVLKVMRTRDNNWKDAGLLGVLSAAVVLEDTLLLKEAIIQLKSYFYSRSDNNVRITGPGWKINNSNNVIYLPREVIRNDGRSGLTYTAYALTTMTQCIEIARYSGFDFWEHETQQGATIADVIKQYYLWDIKRENFPWNSNPNRTTKRRNLYELANTFLDMGVEFEEFVQNNWPLTNGREGDEYCTITKGAITGVGIAPPKAPTNLEAISVVSKQIELNWIDNSRDETGFSIERRTNNSSFFTVARVDANITFYSDKLFLTDSTTYIYRIKALGQIANSDYSNEAIATTVVSVENGYNSTPNEMMLYQNYPNPFNPSTAISFYIPEKQFISLKVFTILGSFVSTLYKGEISKGSYKVHLDGEILLSNGIYLYRLESNEKSITNKMLFLK